MIKRLITVILCFLITLFVYIHQDLIISNVFSIYNMFREVEYEETTSAYTKGQNFEYVSITDSFVPYNYQDLLNIFYTALDRRFSSITFYCPREYKECLDDVDTFKNDTMKERLTIIGNLVSPFNNYSNISIYSDTTGKVTFGITYLYDDEMIEYVNSELDNMFNSIITEGMDDTDKITAIHDYIIAYTDYDTEYEEELNTTGVTSYPSNTAYGLFKYKKAICSGYTDVMALVLDRLQLENFKVASKTHIWNVLKSTNGYLHIDLTWDDPTNNIFNIKMNDYLLISTERLHELDSETHVYDESIYVELAS